MLGLGMSCGLLRVTGAHQLGLVAWVVCLALMLTSPMAAAQSRPTASLWVGGGFGGKLDDSPIASVGVRVQNVGVVFYEAIDLQEFSPSGSLGADPVSGSQVDSLRGFDLIYFTRARASRQLTAYTGGGYYFERGCSQLVVSEGQSSCEVSYDEKHFAYTAGIHFSPGRFIIGYGYHSLKGNEITLGLKF